MICGAHREPGDVALGRALTAPLITISCEIAFAGASAVATTARLEAIATLELAVLAAGGRLSVTSVTSALARYYPAAAPTGRTPVTG